MYTLEDVYKTFPSGCTEDYKILRAFEMGKQEGGAKVKELEAQIEKMKCCENCKHHRFCGDVLECKIIDCNNLESWELTFGVSN
jgi:hypothetical protein